MFERKTIWMLKYNWIAVLYHTSVFKSHENNGGKNHLLSKVCTYVIIILFLNIIINVL